MLNGLPAQVFQRIANKLDVETAVALSGVSKKCKDLSADYRLWDQFTFRDFGVMVDHSPNSLTVESLAAAVATAKAYYGMQRFTLLITHLLAALDDPNNADKDDATRPVNAINALRDWSSLNEDAKKAGISEIRLQLQSVISYFISFDLKYKWTPLHWAADSSNQLYILKALLAHPETDVNRLDDEGRTPLLIAAYQGYLGNVKALLAHRHVDVNKADEYGNTPLHWAAGHPLHMGHPGIVKALLAHPSIDAEKKNNEGHTPMSAAAACGDREIEITALIAKHLAQKEEALCKARAAATAKLITIHFESLAGKEKPIINAVHQCLKY